jgi:hypothetical protein
MIENKNTNIEATFHVNNNINAEYIYIIEDSEVWFNDYIICIAFKTPIDFKNKINGLYKSGRSYREFQRIIDLQNYLDQITTQETVFEASVDSKTNQEYENMIVWHTIGT